MTGTPDEVRAGRRKGQASLKDHSGHSVKEVLERAGRPVRKLLYQFRQDSWDPEAGRGVRSGEQELTRDVSR